MPKIINDVENTIKKCAIELFTELSYTDVDMKMISKKSGVAVGTLYNYYENKKQLYLSILRESWQNTFDKLDNINGLREFIVILYEDIKSRNGLGKALINTSAAELKDDKDINDLKTELISRIEKLLTYHTKAVPLEKYSNINTRLAESLLASTLTMLEFHPNDKEENINFLVEFTSLSMK